MLQSQQSIAPCLTLNPNPTALSTPAELQAFWDNDETAQAYVLDKYNTGITLTKADANGVFHQVHTVMAIDANGNPVYSKLNCN